MELKPCPFCGGKAFAWEWNGGARIDCENWTKQAAGRVHYVGVGAPTMGEAVELWNGRKTGNKKEPVN